MKDFILDVPQEKPEITWPNEPPIFHMVADRIAHTDYTACPELQDAIMQAAEEPFFNPLDTIKELANRDAERGVIRQVLSFVTP